MSTPNPNVYLPPTLGPNVQIAPANQAKQPREGESIYAALEEVLPLQYRQVVEELAIDIAKDHHKFEQRGDTLTGRAFFTDEEREQKRQTLEGGLRTQIFGDRQSGKQGIRHELDDTTRAAADKIEATTFSDGRDPDGKLMRQSVIKTELEKALDTTFQGTADSVIEEAIGFIEKNRFNPQDPRVLTAKKIIMNELGYKMWNSDGGITDQLRHIRALDLTAKVGKDDVYSVPNKEGGGYSVVKGVDVRKLGVIREALKNIKGMVNKSLLTQDEEIVTWARENWPGGYDKAVVEPLTKGFPDHIIAMTKHRFLDPSNIDNIISGQIVPVAYAHPAFKVIKPKTPGPGEAGNDGAGNLLLKITDLAADPKGKLEIAALVRNHYKGGGTKEERDAYLSDLLQFVEAFDKPDDKLEAIRQMLG